MKGAKDKVSGLCGHECDFHRRAIAHFTNQNDFGRLAEGCPQPIWIIVKIVTQFPLVKRGTECWMDEFDRILEGDNVNRLFGVDLIEYRSQRRCFAAASGAGD